MMDFPLNGPVLESILHQLLPEKPVLTSSQAGLKNCFLANFQHSSYELPEHCVPFHVLEVVDRHTISQHDRCIAGERYAKPLQGGEVFFYPANAQQWVNWSGTSGFSLLVFHPHLFETEFDCHPEDLFPLLKPHDPHIQILVEKIKQDLREGCPLGSAYSDAQALALIAELVRQMKPAKALTIVPSHGLPPHQLAMVREFIDTKIHAAQDPQLTEIAQILNMSQFHFLRLFKESMGMTPGKYVTQQRMERGKYLLQTTNLSIVEVALQCGCSPRNFNGLFKKVVGVAPSDFRREFRNLK